MINKDKNNRGKAAPVIPKIGFTKKRRRLEYGGKVAP